MRHKLIIVALSALGLVAGCSSGNTTPMSAEPAATASTEQHFEEQARDEITEDNYLEELSVLEAEIEADATAE